MKQKLCEICNKPMTNRLERFIGFLLRNNYEFKTCTSCRDLASKGFNIEQIREVLSQK